MNSIIEDIIRIFNMINAVGLAVIGILLIFPNNSYFTFEMLKPLLGILFLMTSVLTMNYATETNNTNKEKEK